MTGGPLARAVLVAATLAAALAGCGVRPSGVITGVLAPSGPAEGAELYLVSAGELAPVLRPTDRRLSPVETLALLAAGPSPEERAQGLRSDVPADLEAVAVSRGRAETEIVVTLTGDVSGLSGTALGQLTCTTVVAVFPDTAPGQVMVTVAGGGRRTAPRACLPG